MATSKVSDSFKESFKLFDMPEKTSFTITFPESRSSHLICISTAGGACQAFMFAYKTNGAAVKPVFYRIDDKTDPTLTANNNNTITVAVSTKRTIQVIDFVLRGELISVS